MTAVTGITNCWRSFV